MNFLVVDLGSISNAVLSLAFFKRALELKDSNIIIVCTHQNRCVFERALRESFLISSARISIEELPKDFSCFLARSYINELEKKHSSFDFSFCLDDSFQSAVVSFFSSASSRIGFSSSKSSFLYTDSMEKDFLDGVHEIQKRINLLKFTGAKTLAWANDEKSILGRAANSSKKIAFYIHNSSDLRSWSSDHNISFLKLLISKGFEVSVLSGPDFLEAKSLEISKIKASVDSVLVDYKECKDFDNLVDEISAASLLVAPDSIAIQVASDLSVPTLALFGPNATDPSRTPWRADSKLISLDLECSPCGAKKRCPLSHRNCMETLLPDYVFSFFKSLEQVSKER